MRKELLTLLPLLFGLLVPCMAEPPLADKQKQAHLYEKIQDDQGPLTAGFWQIMPGIEKQFTDEQLEDEVKHFRALGMTYIMIHYATTWWDHEAETYYALHPSEVLPHAKGFEGRDPIGAIVRGAEKYGAKVILGDTLTPFPRYDNWQDNLDHVVSDKVMAYREEWIKRYAKSPAIVGFYLSNEVNPYQAEQMGCDINLFISMNNQITQQVKSLAPHWITIAPIGLYARVSEAGVEPSPLDHMQVFWPMMMREHKHVDAWMVIDGLGTRLSNPAHTDKAQQLLKTAAHKYGKAFWVDVECAVMGGKNRPYQITELLEALDIAKRHGDRLTTFDYLHYISKQSPKPAARKLHHDYEAYLHDLKEVK